VADTETFDAEAERTSESASENRNNKERFHGQSVFPINDRRSLGLPESFPQREDSVVTNVHAQSSRDGRTDGNELPIQPGAQISSRKRQRNPKAIAEESPTAASDNPPKKRNRTKAITRMESTRQSSRRDSSMQAEVADSVDAVDV
jgi:hypothetical protein